MARDLGVIHLDPNAVYKEVHITVTVEMKTSLWFRFRVFLSVILIRLASRISPMTIKILQSGV